MLMDKYSLQDALLAMESALSISYDAGSVEEIIKDAHAHVEKFCNVRLDTDIYTVQAQNAFAASPIEALLDRIAAGSERIAFISSISLYTKKPPISLADVNYLGYTAETLLSALRHLQDRILYARRESIVRSITSALNNVELCQVKRLAIIMLVLEDLGIPEAVAICAQLLFIGGISR